MTTKFLRRGWSRYSKLKEKDLITKEQISDIRKKIKNRYFKNKNQLKEYINTKK